MLFCLPPTPNLSHWLARTINCSLGDEGRVKLIAGDSLVQKQKTDHHTIFKVSRRRGMLPHPADLLNYSQASNYLTVERLGGICLIYISVFIIPECKITGIVRSSLTITFFENLVRSWMPHLFQRLVILFYKIV